MVFCWILHFDLILLKNIDIISLFFFQSPISSEWCACSANQTAKMQMFGTFSSCVCLTIFMVIKAPHRASETDSLDDETPNQHFFDSRSFLYVHHKPIVWSHNEIGSSINHFCFFVNFYRSQKNTFSFSIFSFYFYLNTNLKKSALNDLRSRIEIFYFIIRYVRMITISSCLVTGDYKDRRGLVTELFVLVFLLHRKLQTLSYFTFL